MKERFQSAVSAAARKILTDHEADRLAELVANDPGVQLAVAEMVAAVLTRPVVEPAQARDGCKCADASCGHCRKDHVFGGQCAFCKCGTFI